MEVTLLLSISEAITPMGLSLIGTRLLTLGPRVPRGEVTIIMMPIMMFSTR